jgi:hypothetical protein
MEEKIEIEARYSDLESIVKGLRKQLSEYDQDRLREQDEYVEAAEKEMNEIRLQSSITAGTVPLILNTVSIITATTDTHLF